MKIITQPFLDFLKTFGFSSEHVSRVNNTYAFMFSLDSTYQFLKEGVIRYLKSERNLSSSTLVYLSPKSSGIHVYIVSRIGVKHVHFTNIELLKITTISL